RGFADQSTGIGSRWCVHGDVVGCRQQRLEALGCVHARRELAAAKTWGVGKDLEPEALGLGDERAPDAAETDEPERLAPEPREPAGELEVPFTATSRAGEG